VTPHYAVGDAAALAAVELRAAVAEERLSELKALLEDMRRAAAEAGRRKWR
jgi:hypothetical protein